MSAGNRGAAPDPVARRIAGAALVVGLLALVLSAYAVHLGIRYLEDVRTLGEALETAEREIPVETMDLTGPPPALDVE